MRRASLLLSAAAAAGCATDGPPAERPGEAFVPRAVGEFTAESARQAAEGVALVSGEAPSDSGPKDGWHRTPRAAGPEQVIVPVAGTDVPPAPVTSFATTSSVPPAPAPEPGTASTGLAAASTDTSEALPPVPAEGKPIDLGTALALVAGRNPQVNFARARVREAYATLDRASVAWLPNLRAGVSYDRHTGRLQDVQGRIIDVNRTALNAGFGAGGVAAGTTTVPGLVMSFHAADALFGPEIARRSAWASRHAADAEVNDRLLEVALAYLELTAAWQRLAVIRQTLESARDLARTTGQFARTGEGLTADAERAVTEFRLRRNDLLRAEEEVAVASARLASLIRLDPTERLAPVECAPAQIDLVASGCEPRQLVAEALGRRPELREQRALVAAACERLRREKYAPLVPSVLVGASYSGFGGGIGPGVGNFGDRTDFDALAYWEVRGLGLGERAARNEAASRIDQARFRELRQMDEIAREVVEAQAQVAARRPQIAIAEEAVNAATRSYELSRQRIHEAQGLPIEALQAIQALDAARREYVRAVTDYNAAQFRLHRALGWPVGR